MFRNWRRCPTLRWPTRWNAPPKPTLTVSRGWRIAMIAAMKNVLSPISEAPITPIDLPWDAQASVVVDQVSKGECNYCGRKPA